MPFYRKKEKEEPKKIVVEAPISREEKFKRLQVISSQLDKAHESSNTLVRLGSRIRKIIPCIPLQLPTLDYEVLGVGGIPRGRIIEIYGPESSGKTTMALEIVAAEQALGGIAAFVDAEHALSVFYAKELGVNIEDLLLSQPNNGEEALDTVEKLIDSKCVSLIVVDSVAALVPKAELEGQIGDAVVGLQARLMSQACRKFTGKCAKNNVTLVFINQIREKIGVMFGSPETTTGGRALKFYASVRLDVRRRKEIKVQPGDRLVGHTLHIKAVKNKVATPLRETDLELYYPETEFEPGLDKVGSTIEYATMRGLFEMSGSWYYYDLGNKDEKDKPIGKECLANGLDNLKTFLRDNPKALQVIRKAIEKLIKLESETNDTTSSLQQASSVSDKA